MPSAVKFTNVTCQIGRARLVDDISLDISEGEFFALLGPAGTGKSSVLRLIGGFEKPTSGEIRIMGETMFDMPPYRRPVNTVFQDFALFPHLSVAENVAYGLMIAGEGRARRLRLADEMLDNVNIGGLGDRDVRGLTSEERQRVALARALIMKPSVLLLDEPMVTMDQKAREHLQQELKVLQRDLGLTFIVATHDHDEALSLADRVAVLNDGRIEQIGTPQELYARPANEFVARFVGFSNVFPPEITHLLTGHAVYSSLRPEAIRITNRGKTAIVLACSFLGASTRVQMELAGTEVTALLPRGTKVPEPGQKIHVAWNDADLHLMEPS